MGVAMGTSLSTPLPVRLDPDQPAGSRVNLPQQVACRDSGKHRVEAQRAAGTARRFPPNGRRTVSALREPFPRATPRLQKRRGSTLERFDLLLDGAEDRGAGGVGDV